MLIIVSWVILDMSVDRSNWVYVLRRGDRKNVKDVSCDPVHMSRSERGKVILRDAVLDGKELVRHPQILAFKVDEDGYIEGPVYNMIYARDIDNLFVGGRMESKGICAYADELHAENTHYTWAHEQFAEGGNKGRKGRHSYRAIKNRGTPFFFEENVKFLMGALEIEVIERSSRKK